MAPKSNTNKKSSGWINAPTGKAKNRREAAAAKESENEKEQEALEEEIKLVEHHSLWLLSIFALCATASFCLLDVDAYVSMTCCGMVR